MSIYKFAIIILFSCSLDSFCCDSTSLNKLYLVKENNSYHVGVQLGLPELKMDLFEYSCKNKTINIQGKLGSNISDVANICVLKKYNDGFKVIRVVKQIETGKFFEVEVVLLKDEILIIESEYSQILGLKL